MASREMKALLLDRYGGPDVLHVGSLPRPVPAPEQVLVRVEHVGLNRGEAKRRAGELSWLSSAKAPDVLGSELAGEIVEVGAGVRGRAVGERVLGMRPVLQGGAYAELVAVSAACVAPIAATVTSLAAAVTPLAGSTVLQALRDRGRCTRGSRVLVGGAAGGVGTFGVRIGKILGAHVTAVCSARNVELVRTLGADEVVSYETSDPLQSGSEYDVIFDTSGTMGFSSARRRLRPGGCFVTTVPSPSVFAWSFGTRWSSRRCMTFLVQPRGPDLALLASLLAKGELEPVIEAVYPFAEVARAHAHLETGRPRGKLALAWSS